MRLTRGSSPLTNLSAGLHLLGVARKLGGWLLGGLFLLLFAGRLLLDDLWGWVLLAVVVWALVHWSRQISRLSVRRAVEVIAPEGARTAVYRLCDRDGNLLYVGIAADPDERLRQHAADPGKRWWWWRFEDGGYSTVAWMPSREAAKQLESDVIRGRTGEPRPWFNIAENTAVR